MVPAARGTAGRAPAVAVDEGRGAARRAGLLNRFTRGAPAALSSGRHGASRLGPDPSGSCLPHPPAARRPAPPRLQPLVGVAPGGAQDVRAPRPAGVVAPSQPRARAPGERRLVVAPERSPLHGRVRRAPRPVRRLHGGRVGPLVPATPRPRAPRPHRVLLRRVRASPRPWASTPAASASSRATTRRRRATWRSPSSGSACSTARATSTRRSTPTGTRSTRTRTTTRRRSRSSPSPTPTATRSSVPVELPGRTVTAAVWRAQVGRTPVLLLDTDIPENDDADRPITHILYVRGREMRLHQELVLGVGGVRALRALGITPSVWHLNEGHSAFLLAERTREMVAKGAAVDGRLRRGAARQRLHHPHAGLGGQRALRCRPRPACRRAPLRR